MLASKGHQGPQAGGGAGQRSAGSLREGRHASFSPRLLATSLPGGRRRRRSCATGAALFATLWRSCGASTVAPTESAVAPAAEAAVPLRVQEHTVQQVNCGGHFAETCHACPTDFSWAWCNGDCLWAFSRCRRSTPSAYAARLLEAIAVTWYSWLPVVVVAAAVTMYLYAIGYRKWVVSKYPLEIQDSLKEKRRDPAMLEERRLGLSAVLSDPNTCLWAFCCTPVLAAKNYHVGQVLHFWPSCLALGFTLYSPFLCAAVLARTSLSARLQRNLGYRPSSLATGCLLNLFCLPCEVGRESLEVDMLECMEAQCLFDIRSTWI